MLGMRLAKISSQRENDFISHKSAICNRVWISPHAIFKEGMDYRTFWIDFAENGWSNWGEKQPREKRGLHDNCSLMISGNIWYILFGKWKAAHCYIPMPCYACEGKEALKVKNKITILMLNITHDIFPRKTQRLRLKNEC